MDSLAEKTSLRSILSSAWLRCLIALTMEMFGTWLVNVCLYPLYVGVMPEARDVSSFVGVLVFVALAVWALRRPDSIDERLLTTMSMVGFALSFGIILLGIFQQQPIVLLLGSVLRSASSRWLVVLTGISLCKLDGRACALCVASALLMSYVLRLPFAALSDTACLVVLVLLPFIGCAACRPLALSVLSVMKASAPPVEASITQPASYVPFAHGLFVSIFVFRVAYGFALTFGSVDGAPQQAFLTVLPLAIVFGMVFAPKMPKADVFYSAAALLVVAGFLASAVLTAADREFGSLVNGLLYAGSECFDVLMWFALASIGARNETNALAVFAWGRAASSAGLLLGATIGHGANAETDALTVSVALATVLFVFVAINLTVLKNFSFQSTIDGVREASIVIETPGSSSVGLREKCVAVARRCRLTPRETELLDLLAHGRNGPFIQEKLVLSRNTVKTHVSNIYAKLGVHSQQELIDIVEQAEVFSMDGEEGRSEVAR
ncbi:helix-turn-helix transcriptional regulator [Paraeggerthella hongkongensis]|uniref:Helix-turn-helix transcriptional regulator n=2 Tax=Paraeggerthella hongkongensis TaxID=230658 RepID=A0A3N0BAT1_9ACTN|nr:helix-turn-helix transcriptional regulator [Paraeggerthella hongkongensis]